MRRDSSDAQAVGRNPTISCGSGNAAPLGRKSGLKSASCEDAMNWHVFVLLCWLPAPLFAQREQSAQSKSLAITNVTVIDCGGREPQADMSVLITGDRILAIGKAKEIAVPQDATVIDGTGKFLIPGLWDMHTHGFGESERNLFLANGVTGVRMMWGGPSGLRLRSE